jgi:hypothetical protein
LTLHLDLDHPYVTAPAVAEENPYPTGPFAPVHEELTCRLGVIEARLPDDHRFGGAFLAARHRAV